MAQNMSTATATPLSADNSLPKASALPGIFAIASMLIGTLLIFWAYAKLSQTWDESAHIGTGMEWLSQGTYTLDPIDPPLPRVSTAVGPYLLGIRSFGNKNPWDEGNLVLAAHGVSGLHHILTAARLGILPYFLIAGFLTWHVTRRWLGPWAAAIATFLFATCPPVLAHASLATTDMAFVATFLLTIHFLWSALSERRPYLYALAGISFGLACISKLTALPYLTLCGATFVLFLLWRKKQFPRLTAWLLFACFLVLTIWAGYHFSVGPLATQDAQSQQTIDHIAHKFGPLSRPAAYTLNHLPAYQYIQGLRIASRLKKSPPLGFLMGDLYRGGKWYFYVVMLLFKTPIPLLLLAFAGAYLALRRLFVEHENFAIVPLAAIIFPILVATASNVNLGIRHVLVIYPFFAMLAALSCITLYRRLPKSPQVALGIIAVLLAWQFVSTLRVAPDYLTYLNETVASRGSYVANDSDYDWGQDIYRMRDKLEALHATDVWIAYSGAADLHSYDLPSWKKLEGNEHVTGWVAVSETMMRERSGEFGWLEQYKPVAEAGKTIRIYHID